MSSTRRRAAPVSAVAGVLFALSGALAAGASEAAPPARRVESVAMVPEGLVPSRELRELLAAPVPGSWDEAAVERTRLLLLATGRFDDVEAEPPSDGGTVLSFRAVPRPFVRSVRVRGAKQVHRQDLVARLDLRAWRAFTEEAALAVPAQVLEVYEREGLPEPRVALLASPPGERGEVEVVLLVEETPLPRLRGLEKDLGGLPWVTSLSTRLKLAAIRVRSSLGGFNEKKLSELLRKEQRRLRSAGWKGAEARVEKAPAGDGVRAKVSLDLGPRESVKGKGVPRQVLHEVETAWKRRNVPLSEGVVTRLSRVATSGMKEEGWLDAEVVPVLREEGGKRTLLLTAARGERTKVAAVRFEGNATLTEKALGKAVVVAPPRLLGLEKSRPGPEALEESRKGILALAAKEGFPAAKVEARVEGEGAERTVVFAVTEGPRQLLSSVGFPGASTIPEEELLRVAGVAAGAPYWPAGAARVAEALKTAYALRGYDEATVTPRAVAGADGKVALAFEVAEGEASRLGSTVVSGGFKTRASVAFAQRDAGRGDPLDPAALANLQTRLANLGVFDSVAVRSVADPLAAPGEKAAVVEVTERPTGYTEYGVDLNTQRGVELAGTLGEKDLFGRAITGSVSTLLGKERQSFSGELARPSLLGLRLYNAVKASYTYDETYEGFALTTLAAELGLAWEFDSKRRITTTYRLERQEPKQVAPDVDEELAPERVRIGSITPAVSFDLRDDPFLPATGWYVMARDKVSRTFLGGDVDYDRWELDGRFFRPVRGVGTLALAGRLGYARAASGSELPAGERFFLGGASTHRGFKEKELGPKGVDGSPLGGTSYVLANVELRVPFWGPLEAGAFLDVGNAYEGRIDVTDLRFAAGLGARLRTPVGPLRVDVGWLLDRREGDPSPVFHLALGHAF